MAKSETPPGLPDDNDLNEEAGSGRGMDPEIRLMGRMVRMLDEVDEPARSRVVAWLSARYFDDYKRTA